MAIPNHCGMPPLSQNIEGLRSHSLLTSMFLPQAEVSPEARKWRSWLVHWLVKTARHYDKARRLILAQLAERERAASEIAKGRALPILNFALAMEDCVTSLEKTVVCINALQENGQMLGGHVLALESERGTLKKLRNQQEHMHIAIAGGQTGGGPICATVSEDGEAIKFRALTMSFAALHRLVDAAYLDIAALYPVHDARSAPTGAGVPSISLTVVVEEICPGQPPKRIF